MTPYEKSLPLHLRPVLPERPRSRLVAVWAWRALLLCLVLAGAFYGLREASGGEGALEPGDNIYGGLR